MNLSNSILQVFTNGSRKTYWILFAILACIIAIFSLSRIYYGLSPIWMPWDDVFDLLNGAWRIVNGQIPHVDFYNPLGILSFIPTAIVMKFGNISSSSLVYGNIIFGLLITLWSWTIAKKRLSAIITFIFSLFIFFLATSTRPLGYTITETSYAMVYNRYGYALFALLIVQLFIPHKSSDKYNNSFEGLQAGILLSLLFYCKITYFLAGLVSIIVFMVLNKISRSWVITLLAGFFIICLGMFVFLHLNPISYLGDFYTALRSQSENSRLYDLYLIIKNNYIAIYLTFILFLLSIIARINSTNTDYSFKDALKQILVITMIISLGLIISSGNAKEFSDIPIFFIASLVILGFLSQDKTLDTKERLTNSSLVLLSVALIGIPLLMGNILLNDTLSEIKAAIWNKSQLSSFPSSQRFQSASLYDFVIPTNADWKNTFWLAEYVPQRLNEGFNLLQPHINKDTRIFCLCHTDPFSFGLGLAPAIGTPLWWAEDYSFNASVYPNPDDLFRNVNLVIIPILYDDDQGCCKDTFYLMDKLYGDYIRNNFIELDKSAHWELMIKK